MIIGAGVTTASLALVSLATLNPDQPVATTPLAFNQGLERTRLTVDEASRGGGRETALSPLSAWLPANRPRQVGGLSQAQMDNADVIVWVGKELNLPKNAYIVAIATALQEGKLNNLANPNVPASMRYPHQGSDSNYDSVGLFQQRPSQGWGTVAQLMDPRTSARLFYTRLARVPGWQSMSVSEAAQSVQRSAFPGAYTKHVELASQLVNTLV